MINDVFTAIGAAARKLFSNWGALLIAFLIFVALWSVCALFAANLGLATKLQVLRELVLLPLLAVVLFFILQAVGLSYVRIGVGADYLLKRALRDCWKLLVISLPLILVAWLIVYIFNKAEATFFSDALMIEATRTRQWAKTIVAGAEIFLLYFLLPLLAIHLWIAAVREGVAGAVKGSLRSLAQAFAPRSVLIYALVVVGFGALAYLLFFTETQFGGEWTQLWIVGIKFALAWVIVFFGWLLVLGALAELTARRALSELES